MTTNTTNGRPAGDPYAALAGIELRPTGAGGVTALCLADPGRHADGAPLYALIAGSTKTPVDLADLAYMAAEHRAAHLVDGTPLCTCPTGPVDGATRRETDPGCPEHGRVAEALDVRQRFNWFIDRLARLLGAGPELDAFAADPEAVMQAAILALEAAKQAMAGADPLCRIHQDRDPGADAPRWHGGCEECRQPRRVRKARELLDAMRDARSEPADAGDQEGAPA